MAEFSCVASLQVLPNDSSILTSSLYGQAPAVEHALLSLQRDTISYDAMANHGRFILGGSGDVMTWRGVVPQLQDVNGDGKPDSTYTHMTYRRVHGSVAQMMH